MPDAVLGVREDVADTCERRKKASTASLDTESEPMELFHACYSLRLSRIRYEALL